MRWDRRGGRVGKRCFRLVKPPSGVVLTNVKHQLSARYYHSCLYIKLFHEFRTWGPACVRPGAPPSAVAIFASPPPGWGGTTVPRLLEVAFAEGHLGLSLTQ